MGSSQTRNWTRVPCIGRRTPNRWATKEAQLCFFFLRLFSLWEEVENFQDLLLCCLLMSLSEVLPSSRCEWAASNTWIGQACYYSCPLSLVICQVCEALKKFMTNYVSFFFLFFFFNYVSLCRFPEHCYLPKALPGSFSLFSCLLFSCHKISMF